MKVVIGKIVVAYVSAICPHCQRENRFTGDLFPASKRNEKKMQCGARQCAKEFNVSISKRI